MFLSFTDKLILCQAVELFNNNSPKIRLYLKARIPHFNVKEWEQEYIKLKKEAFAFYYKNPMQYCLDRKSLTVPRSINDKFNIKENRRFREEDYKNIEDPSLIVNYFEPIFVTEEECKITTINMERTERRHKQYAGNEEEKNLQKKEELPTKVSKRLWQRMTLEERSYEETITAVEDQAYSSDNVCVSIESNDFAIPTEEERIRTLEEHFESLISKYHNRKSLKDKSQWMSEYKIMIKYFIFFVKDHFIVPQLQKLTNDDIDPNLANSVVKILVIIQKMIFETEGDLKNELNGIKNKFLIFYDFYKK